MTHPTSRWSKKKILALAGVTLLVHAILLFFVFPALSARLSVSYNQDVFADGYDALAANLAAGNGYRFYPDTAPTLMREPGYPLLLAGVRLVFGDSLTAVKIVNLLLALATALLVLKLAARFTSRQWAMMAAALLFLFHPGTLVAEGRGGVEILFGFLIVLFFLALLKAVESQSLKGFLLCGLVLGLTVIVRSVLILFPVFLLAYLLFVERRRVSKSIACRNVAVMVLAMVAVLSPWIVRNYSLTGRFIPTASVLGVSAHAGQYINTHLSQGKPWWLLDREAGKERDQLATALGYKYEGNYYQCFYRTQDELAFSNFLLHRVISDYRRSPAQFAEVVLRNLFNFWFTGKTSLATAINLAIQLPYLLLAGAGVVIGFRNHRTRFIALTLLLIGYVVAIYIPILAQARYSIPLVPFLSVLGTFSLVAAQEAFETRRGAPVPGSFTSPGAGHSSETAHTAHPEKETALPMSTTIIQTTRSSLDRLANEIPLQPKPRADLSLSIVIPAYNEEQRLPRTVLDTLSFCTRQNLDFEIVIADDGSRDQTLQLAQLFEEKDARVRALSCPHLGKGSAVRMGMLNARGRFVLFMDADGATPLTEIARLTGALEAGADVAFGSRALHVDGDVKVKTSLHRRLIGRVFAFFVNVLAVGGVADTQCGFKMFRREAAAAIFPLQKTPGFAFDVEILYIARRLGFSIVEVPVNWVAQPGSKVNLVRDSIKMLWDITQIRWMHRNFHPALASIREGRGVQGTL